MRFLIYLLIVFIISCKSSNFKEKGKYIFENDFITREIHFINDTICEFKQVYKCEDLNKNFKEFKTIYRYFYNDTTIITSENKKLNLKLLHLKKPAAKYAGTGVAGLGAGIATVPQVTNPTNPERIALRKKIK